MKADRPDGALLAGVCAGIAGALQWNVWVLRALFVGFLVIKTWVAVMVYGVLALVFYLSGNNHVFRRGGGPDDGLGSPELSDRNQRIRDLERRFRDLENNGQ
jgi:phage shock protein PspC (stress-responsive transcriptional regulator)